MERQSRLSETLRAAYLGKQWVEWFGRYIAGGFEGNSSIQALLRSFFSPVSNPVEGRVLLDGNYFGEFADETVAPSSFPSPSSLID